MGYRNVLNAFGRKALINPVQIPDYRLMIGGAETLAPQSIIMYEQALPKQMVSTLPNMERMSYEEVQQNLASGKLSIDDFFVNSATIQDALATD